MTGVAASLSLWRLFSLCVAGTRCAGGNRVHTQPSHVCITAALLFSLGPSGMPALLLDKRLSAVRMPAT